jgi:hypothetical protein
LAILGCVYLIALAIGFATIPSRAHAIPDPIFTVLELLILIMAPAMVSLMAAVHAWAPPPAKVLGLVSLVFMTATAVLTSCVHFAILTLSRHPAFQGAPWSLVFSFKWPSLAYAVDILAWDLFFPFSMFFAAFIFRGTRLARAIRLLMLAAGCLALAGLVGVATGDMQSRNIGILGYAVLFPIIAAFLALLFHRSDGRTGD